MLAGGPDETLTRPLTDLGNAERFAERYRGVLASTPGKGWKVYNGQYWTTEAADKAAMEAVCETIRAIAQEADSGDLSKEQKDRIHAWCKKSEDYRRINAALKIGLLKLQRPDSDFDKDPYLINCANGTLKVDPGADAGDEDPIKFLEHDPADLISKTTGIDYDPAAACPLFERFLADVQPDEDVRRFLKQWGGYCLIGDVSQQKIVFSYGKGKNGKSTFWETVARVAGSYAGTLPIESFLRQKHGRSPGQATPDLATLPGLRLVRTSEPPDGARLDEGLIKQITGGDKMTARALNRSPFEFDPTFKFTMSGNYRPRIFGTDEGIWRRVLLVNWNVTVVNPDKYLSEKLSAEGSGILNWLLDGLRDYLKNGLIVPAGIDDATNEYRSESDPVGRFLIDCTRTAPGARVQAAEAHQLYVAWAKANGETVISAKLLGMRLRGRLKSQHSGVNYWIDIELTRSPRDFVDHDGNPVSQSDHDAPVAELADDDEFR